MNVPRKKPSPSNEPPLTINLDAAKKAQVLAKNAVQLAEVAATALVAAEQLGIKAKPSNTSPCHRPNGKSCFQSPRSRPHERTVAA
jgi:hypothetical protein